MTLASLLKGLALLLLLLLAAGLVTSLGPVELLIWLALVIGWILWWVVRRGWTGAAE